jgi:UDP-glucose 4-epimerase
MPGVLVTGGAGFIGAYVTRRLIAEGRSVVVYDANPTANVLGMLIPDAEVRPDIAVETGDIIDRGRLVALCRRHRLDAAVHLASPLTKDVTERPDEGIRDICLGTSAVFAAAREAGLRRVVWASSVAVFGRKSGYPSGPIADDACQRPQSLYGSCKSLCETLARRAFEIDGLDTVGVRLSVVYGAGRLRGYMSYPSHIIRSAAAGEPIDIPWGRQRVHWQYVEEVADLVAALLASDVAGCGRTYNAPGDSRSWADFGALLKRSRPGLNVSVGDAVDPVLADVVDDYDANALEVDYGYAMGWPLERAVPEALNEYAAMLGRPLAG